MSGEITPPVLLTTQSVTSVENQLLMWTETDLRIGPSAGNLGRSTYSSESLWVQTIGKDGASTIGQPRRLFATKHGSIYSPTWSPNRQMLAFSNDRGTHGFIGVFHVNLPHLNWVAPSYDTDTAPNWSADGSMLAFRRERDMTGLFGVEGVGRENETTTLATVGMNVGGKFP